MSRSRADEFRQRVPEGNLTEQQNHTRRREVYGNIGRGFPSSESLDGYSAEERHATYKVAQARSDAARFAYNRKEASKPLTREYSEAEYSHASLREDVYTRVPYGYATAAAQKDHRD
ncbi:MAG: hypothetical protein Q9218_005550 [Villophora microphyllina]